MASRCLLPPGKSSLRLGSPSRSGAEYPYVVPPNWPGVILCSFKIRAVYRLLLLMHFPSTTTYCAQISEQLSNVMTTTATDSNLPRLEPIPKPITRRSHQRPVEILRSNAPRSIFTYETSKRPVESSHRIPVYDIRANSPEDIIESDRNIRTSLCCTLSPTHMRLPIVCTPLSGRVWARLIRLPVDSSAQFVAGPRQIRWAKIAARPGDLHPRVATPGRTDVVHTPSSVGCCGPSVDDGRAEVD